MNYLLMPQEKKADILENAVINLSDDEIKRLYGELGYVEMSAPSLGLACRFRGSETVRTLTDMGATFDFPSTKDTEEKYRCYIGEKYGNYRTNYSLYLLKIFRGEMKGACSTKGMSFFKNMPRREGKPLSFISDDERIKVLRLLYDNREKIAFEPEEMLYYAVFAGDRVIADELKGAGVCFSDIRIKTITEGGAATDGYWFEYGKLTGALSDGNYLPVMERIASELDGKRFYLTDKIYELTKKRFHNADILKFFFDNFRHDKLNKIRFIQDLIAANSTEGLMLAEQEGWIGTPRTRDNLIEFASKSGNPEMLSWLLDYKNRTADIAAEREKKEKRELRELNASPDSVMMLKKIWSYKKQEDGSLVITNYKGTDKTEVTVPERIGKSIVTAIGNGAFAGASGVGAGSVTANFTHEQMQARRKITKITLPKTLKFIGRGAFTFLRSLKNITIPDGVEEIDAFAFDDCDSLTEITVPGTVKKIGMYAFAGCDNLSVVKICEGVLEIGAGAFSRDTSLKKVELPESLRRMLTQKLRFHNVEALDFSSSLTAYCPKGSYAEKYCKEKGIAVKTCEEKI